MIGYVTLGTNNLIGPPNLRCLAGRTRGDAILPNEGFIAWADADNGAIAPAPYNGQPATTGNGTMVALAADTPATVDAVYRKAIELGGTCEAVRPKRRIVLCRLFP